MKKDFFLLSLQKNFSKLFKHLSIRNYVLIQELEVDFRNGLSIITGETGAGKSILLGALGLLTGQRADSKDVSQNASSKCIVEGVFDLKSDNWKKYFEANDLEYNPETFIRREISVEGKSRAFINDSPVNLSALKDLGSQIIDIHSQHHNIYLQSPGFQMEILDRYSQQMSAVAEYSQLYSQYRKLQSELDDLQKAAVQHRSDLDYHSFRYNELEAARLVEDELDSLEQELKSLTYAEDIQTGLAQVSSILDADELSVVQMLKSAISTLSKLQNMFEPAENFKQRIESALIELRDISSEAERLAEATELNPDRLKAVSERIDLIYSLQQKHRVSSIKELIAIRDNLQHTISQINNYDAQIEQLQTNISQKFDQLTSLAATISDKRKASIPVIEERILSLLVQLGISNAVFKIDLSSCAELTSNGSDAVRFLFSANRQQSLQDLGKVASGGEMSRLMLSIKAAISEKISLPTLIFDEIDSGVSGEIAGKMGNILEEMAKYAQIINITHLPQIAAKGMSHYKVYKEDKADASHTKIKLLSANERITEIAKMLSGENLTAAAIENAKILLSS